MIAWFTLAQSAFAADLVVGAGGSGTYTCEAGQNVGVEGSSLTITFNGDCGKLTVEGSMNKVTIDGVTSVRVEGSSNTVTWKRNLSGAAKLPVTKVGAGNKVKQG
ncbi:MAG: DUF3060 domain-containing protein [Myxococcota bacterium]